MTESFPNDRSPSTRPARWFTPLTGAEGGDSPGDGEGGGVSE